MSIRSGRQARKSEIKKKKYKTRDPCAPRTLLSPIRRQWRDEPLSLFTGDACLASPRTGLAQNPFLGSLRGRARRRGANSKSPRTEAKVGGCGKKSITPFHEAAHELEAGVRMIRFSSSLISRSIQPPKSGA
ncbi:hypothetical protein MRX96_002815 [Rhipicephalus microplus]